MGMNFLGKLWIIFRNLSFCVLYFNILTMKKAVILGWIFKKKYITYQTLKYDIKKIFLNINDAFLFHVKVPKRYFINIQIVKLEIIRKNHIFTVYASIL